MAGQDVLEEPSEEDANYILKFKIVLFLTLLSQCNIFVTLLQFYYNMRVGLKKVKK